MRRTQDRRLCVSGAPRTEAELKAVQPALKKTPDLLTTGVHGRSGYVELDVIRVTTQLQHRLDTRYGVGVVHLYGAL